MNPSQGKRVWVKLWVSEWLDGTTRFQMSGAQRALWIDLLAMAGRSRYPGIVCAGKNDDKWVGYPLKTLSALDAAGEIDILGTLELFERTGKVSVEVTSEVPVRLYKITICKWETYQSEYLRQKGYQRTYREKNKNLSPKLSEEKRSVYLLEGEVEGEVDKNHCANPSGSHESVPSQATPRPTDEKLLAVERVWVHYIQKLDKNPKLLTFTAGRKQKGLARLRECLTKTGGDLVNAEGLMRCAVDALAASPHHCGQNDSKAKYNSWDKNLFSSLEKLEWWLERT
jgi:hypothetical protein